MQQSENQKQWESAAPGWAKWEKYFTIMMEPATDAMLDMAGVVPGTKVLDLACGAGSQTLLAAKRVGNQGNVVANDISENMLEHVRKNAQAAQLDNIRTLQGAAETLDLPDASFDAVICRLALMLFSDPSGALDQVRCALKPGGKVAAIVVTVPENNLFLVKTHAGFVAPCREKATGARTTGNVCAWLPGRH